VEWNSYSYSIVWNCIKVTKIPKILVTKIPKILLPQGWLATMAEPWGVLTILDEHQGWPQPPPSYGVVAATLGSP
jgi:hypothetical protein